MLIEIMMSALLVGLAATAVFKGIDGATATSAQSKSRAVATSLAHEDQERLRSMDPRKLASYSPGPATKTVNRVNYTVTSTADWVSDRGDSESCSKGDGRVTYVKISSKVEWPDMNGSKPVIASSIVAINNAYAKGSLAVKLVDRTGSGPVKDVPVSVDPPLSLSRNTNDGGCVVFDGLNAGAYYGHFAKSGYVDPNGINDVRPVNGWNVTTGSTSISTYQYDLAGTINFSFVTTIGSTEYAVKADPTVASQVAVEHQGIPGPPSQGVRRDSVAAGSTTYDFDDLFPFTTAYSAYASACDADGPAAVWTSATVTPGGLVAAKLPLPPVRVKVTRTVTPKKGVPGGTTNASNARVKIRPVVTNCASTRTLPNTLSDGTGLTPLPTNAAEAQVVALPYGQFIACADDNAGGSTRKAEVTFTNDTLAGKTVTVDIPDTTSGSC